MNCLDIKITVLNTPLVMKIHDAGKHLNFHASTVCGVDFSWTGLADSEGNDLYDASGDVLLVKFQ